MIGILSVVTATENFIENIETKSILEVNLLIGLRLTGRSKLRSVGRLKKVAGSNGFVQRLKTLRLVTLLASRAQK